MAETATLADYLKTAAPEALAGVIEAAAEVAVRLSLQISRGALEGSLDAMVGRNTDGDGQKALDVMADEAFAAAFAARSVRWYASEERETAEPMNRDGGYAVAIDPLDGSSNIDVNVSIGTIFSVYEAADTGEASFLRPGREQVAAGYFIYGPQTSLILAAGGGLVMFVLDRESGCFLNTAQSPKIPESSTEFAINASNYRHWPRPIRAYIDDCLSGDEGPRGKNFNMRWVASLVAEAHRIMMRGGIFLYPGDTREGYERGRLRMVYECAPIAFLVEQAGGGATNGCDRILDQTPDDLHARTPFVFGSSEKVARVAAYHDLPEEEIVPLFGSRGLFTDGEKG